MKKSENTSKSDRLLNLVQECIDPAKDFLAHKKFLKQSGLVYRGEIARSSFKQGPEGWEMWRKQFLQTHVKGRNILEKELNNLRNQGKLQSDDFLRLRKLYGLEIQFQSRVESEVESIPRERIAVRTSANCPICLADVKPGSTTCLKCGASVLEPEVRRT